MSSDNSASSGDESEDKGPSAPPAKLDRGMSSLLESATEIPLINEKRKKLTSHFPLPSSDAAHPPVG